jgi:hypothetical protein
LTIRPSAELQCETNSKGHEPHKVAKESFALVQDVFPILQHNLHDVNDIADWNAGKLRINDGHVADKSVKRMFDVL